jgi:hypothetical protein
MLTPLYCWLIPLLFGNCGVDGLMKKFIKNSYLSLWSASFTCSSRNRPVMKLVIGEYCRILFSINCQGLVDFHIYLARMWFSEKRLQIPILGLDSLLLQAYKPPPLPRNGKRFWLQGLLLEGLKNKDTKKRF